MRFFVVSFLTELELQLRRKRTWLLILLLPALVWTALRLIPGDEAAAPVRVGVVIPADDPEAEAYLQRLLLRSGTVVTFVPCDGETARGNVAAALWDCALLLPEDFGERVKALETRRLIDLVVSPASTVYPVVRETAAACLAEQLSPRIAADYLREAGAAEKTEIAVSQLPEEQRVLISLSTLGGKEISLTDIGNRGIREVLSGVTAMVLLIWAMFAAVDLGRWLDSLFARRLRGMHTATALLLPRALAALCPALLSAGAALLLLGCPLTQMAALAAYVLLLGALVPLPARWPAVWSALPVMMPFVPALCIVLSPVLVDPAAIFPDLAPLAACMPVTLYLRGETALQLAAAAALLVIQLAADSFRLHKKKKA